MAQAVHGREGTATLVVLLAMAMTFAAVAPAQGEHGPEAPGRGTFRTFTANSATDAPANPMHLTALVVDGQPVTKGTNGEKTGSFQTLVITAADPGKFVVTLGVGTAVGNGRTVRVEDFSGKFSWSTIGGSQVGNIKLDGAAAYVSIRDASGFVLRVEDANSNAVNDFVEDGDGDRLLDGRERHDFLTDPNLADTDGDGFSDGEEVLDLFSDPLDPNDPVPRNAVPGAPRNLDATRGPGPGQTSLAWQAPAFQGTSPVTSYDVFRTAEGVESFAFSTTETSAVDSRLPPGTFFSYRVRAVNSIGPGPFSDSDGDSTFRLPSAPQNLVATSGPGPGQIDLTWQAPADTDGRAIIRYWLNRGTSPDLLEFHGFVTGLTFTDSGNGNGATFYYTVQAETDVGVGDNSNQAAGSTFRLPSAPQDLVARSGPGRGEVELAWQPPADTSGRDVIRYWVNRGTSPDQVDFYRFVTGLAFIDSGNDDGDTFYYTVQAQTDVGAGDASNQAHGTTYTNEPQVEAELPSGVALTSALWQGHYAYVFGGTVDAGNSTQSTDNVVRFDPATGEVLNVTRLPSARHGTSAVWTGPPADSGGSSIQSCHPACAVGLGYLFGGDTLGDTNVGSPMPSSCHPACAIGAQILEFDPVAGTFTQQNAVIDPPRTNTSAVWVPDSAGGASIQSCHPACAIGFAYIIGGAVDDVDANAITPSSCHPACAAGTDILQYDPVNDVITSTNGILPSVLEGVSSVFVPDEATVGAADDGPSVSSCHPACAVGGILIFGGKSPDASLSAASSGGDQILFYDLEEDRVVDTGARLPGPRAFTSAFYDGRYAFVIGGSWNGVAIDEIVRVDPRNLEVKVVTELPSDRGETSVAFDGTSGHIFGGQAETKLDEIVRFTPGAPQRVEATRGPGRGEATVSWEPPAAEGLAPVSGYRVYVGTSSNGQGAPVELGADARSYTASGFGDGVTVYFKVSAISVVGEGPQAREVFAKTFEVPTPPRDLDVVFPSQVGVVHLVWVAPEDTGGSGLTKYEVLRAIDSPTTEGELTPIGETLPDQTEFRDTTCDLPEFCRYAVRAWNVVGASGLSNQVTGIGTQVPSV